MSALRRHQLHEINVDDNHIPNLRAVQQRCAVEGGAIVTSIGKVYFRSATGAVDDSHKGQL